MEILKILIFLKKPTIIVWKNGFNMYPVRCTATT